MRQELEKVTSKVKGPVHDSSKQSSLTLLLCPASPEYLLERGELGPTQSF